MMHGFLLKMGAKKSRDLFLSFSWTFFLCVFFLCFCSPLDPLPPDPLTWTTLPLPPHRPEFRSLFILPILSSVPSLWKVAAAQS